MTEVCKVVKVKRKLVYIEITRTDKCNGCEVCSFNNRKSMTVPAACETEVAAGQLVRVRMPEKSVGAGSLLIYAVPILTMLIGALIGLVGGMWLQIGLCAAGLVLGFVAAFFIDRAYRRAPGVLPEVLGIYDGQTETDDDKISGPLEASATDENGGTNESRYD